MMDYFAQEKEEREKRDRMRNQTTNQGGKSKKTRNHKSKTRRLS
jgi:hypothetical protein